MSVSLNSVPALHSLPGAPVTVYLDFNGQPAQAWGSFNVSATPAYTIDSDVTNFSDQEVAAINEIWARVSEKYSPFNINVTTVDPGTLAAKKAMKVVIGGDGAWTGSVMGGYSYIGTFSAGTYGNISWVFSANLGANPAMIAEAVAHESGHNFGLNHQSTYNGATRVTEYNKGDSLRAPIMGNSYSALRGLWWNGPTKTSTTIQDDLAVLVNSGNNITYRADDHPNSLTAGDPFTVSGASVSAKGIITTTSDVDSFTFTTGAGLVSFIGSVNNLAAMLDLKLSLYNSAGALLQTVDTASLGETLTATLAAGTYTLVVGSHGSYGDIGQFTVSGTIVSTTTAAPAAPTNLAATVSGSQINLSWNDNANNESGYVVQRSTDGGANFANIATLGANINTYSNTGVATGVTYIYRVYATGAGGNSSLSNSASALVPPIPPTPTGLVVTATTATSITFAWTDGANETAYLVQQSPDAGKSWIAVGQTAANVTTFTNTGLQTGKSYMLRVWATNATGTSNVSAAVTATTTASAPLDVTAPTVTAKTPNAGALITASSTNIDVTFSENVTNVDASDLILTGTGATAAIKGTPTLVSGTTWRFPVSNLSTGGVSVSLAPAAGNIVDTANNPLANVTWSFNVSLPAAVMFAAKINFQDSKSAGYAGYLADTGAVYGSRNGLTYGWSRDISNQTRNRNNTASPDERYDTLVQMQRPGNVASWEIAVPNGTYSVRLVAGDPSYTDSVYKINIENTLAINGTPNATTKFFDNTVQVAVTDGKITVSNAAGASNNKICFIEITQIA